MGLVVQKRAPMQTPSRGISYRIFDRLNRLVCGALYRVHPLEQPPLPENGPVLLASDHSSYNDPMVLAATAGRPIIFLTAREVYQHPFLLWFCKTVQYIPVSRGTQDVGAVRAMLRALRQGEVIALFPEGGIDEYREEKGYLGIGYLALKTGVPVVPVSVTWDKARPLTLGRSLLTPGKAFVRYGAPIIFESTTQPDRESIELATARIMQDIQDLRDLNASSLGSTTGASHP